MNLVFYLFDIYSVYKIYIYMKEEGNYVNDVYVVLLNKCVVN